MNCQCKMNEVFVCFQQQSVGNKGENPTQFLPSSDTCSANKKNLLFFKTLI